MNANLMTKKIEMTKTEAKAAGKPNTDEYNTLLELMKSFETASAERRVVTIESEYERSAPMLYPDIHGVLKD